MTRILQAKVESGQRLVATDITDLTFFPAGSILMMDGGWTDGRGGWYICDGRSTPYGNTPDLRDKFIKGNGNKPAVGNGQMTLTTGHLPAHKHSITDQKHKHTVTILTSYSGSGGNDSYGIINRGSSSSGITISEEFTGITSTNDSTGGGQAFDVLPSYYSVIYIKKMA